MERISPWSKVEAQGCLSLLRIKFFPHFLSRQPEVMPKYSVNELYWRRPLTKRENTRMKNNFMRFEINLRNLQRGKSGK
jgi:hypothetical protein